MKIELDPATPIPGSLVASFVFVDLVGFSKKSTTDQYAEKAILTGILKSSLQAISPTDYMIKDTGDGAWIGFVGNPDHALYIALSLLAACRPFADQSALTRSDLRVGLNLGTVKQTLDLESRLNFVGDGINVAQRVMDFARPGQITASRSYYEAVVWLDSGFPHLFTHIPSGRDKHGREHDLYAIEPDLDVLQKLQSGLVPASIEREASREVHRSPTRWVAAAALAMSFLVGAAILAVSWLPSRAPMAAPANGDAGGRRAEQLPMAPVSPAAPVDGPSIPARSTPANAPNKGAEVVAPIARSEPVATEPGKAPAPSLEGKTMPLGAAVPAPKSDTKASFASADAKPVPAAARAKPRNDPDLDFGHDEDAQIINALPAGVAVPRTLSQPIPRQGGRRPDASLTPDGAIRLPGDRRPERDGRGMPPGPPGSGGDAQIR